MTDAKPRHDARHMEAMSTFERGALIVCIVLTDDADGSFGHVDDKTCPSRTGAKFDAASPTRARVSSDADVVAATAGGFRTRA
jgi:hypothetical protein